MKDDLKKLEKVKYSCSKCGWQTSIIVAWADLRPKRCLGKRCKTSFLREPSALLVELPQAPEVPNMQGKKKKKEKEQDA